MMECSRERTHAHAEIFLRRSAFPEQTIATGKRHDIKTLRIYNYVFLKSYQGFVSFSDSNFFSLLYFWILKHFF